MRSSHYISISSGRVIARVSAGLVFTLLLLVGGLGCRKADAPPPALTLEQLPPALEKAFARGKADASEKLKPVLGALREKDYSKAFMDLQALSVLPGLSREQADVAAAGLITLNNTLQEAQSQGDQNAAQTLQSYRATK